MGSEAYTSAGFRSERGQLRVTLPRCIGQPIDGFRGETRGEDASRRSHAISGVTPLSFGEPARAQHGARGARPGGSSCCAWKPTALHWLECALGLLDDYGERGLLRYERQTMSRTSRGRIDWRDDRSARTRLPLGGQQSFILAPIFDLRSNSRKITRLRNCMRRPFDSCTNCLRQNWASRCSGGRPE